MNPPCFVSRFREVVRAQPEAVGILDRGRPALTYGELLERAERVAWCLQERGVGEETVVALAVEKSVNYLVGLLGVWFAGAAFLPLDPIGAPERLRFMLADSKAGWVLTHKRCRKKWAGVKAEHIDIEEAQCGLRSSRATSINPESLAYVIYSSGSTGQPKGIEVPHRGIVNLLDAQIAAFDIGPEDRSLFYLSPLFDASISDIGTAFLSGATLCLEPRVALENLSRLGSVLRERRITHLDFPPSLLGLLDPKLVSGNLRTLILGGEACPPRLLRQWARRLRLINVYGPTEATVCVSLCEVDARTWQRPFLGKPIPNVAFHLLGPDLAPVSTGQVAELYIGGIGLARRYINLPTLTAQRFVERRGERLFRTGDRVIQHSNGDIEFLGRWDRQVKLNGVLVAPEEIETRLRSHPQVSQAAVVPKSLGKRRALHAYLVLNESAEQKALVRIQEQLKKQLPAAMLPHRWEILEELPKTPNGKIDLAALEARPCQLAAAQQPSANTPLEVVFCRIWKKILKCSTLGVHQNFFEAGGDSLGAIEMIAIAEQHNIHLTPELLFARPTIAGLAAAIENGGSAEIGMSVKELRADVEFNREWHRLLLKAKARPLSPAEQAPRNILLTGATGFLGRFLLRELLSRTSAIIHCLVRAEDRDHGRRRVLSALAAEGISLSTNEERRIRIVPGDLSEFRLGISREGWTTLCDEIDTAYHCAAETNLLSSYRELSPTNVGGTREILRLVCEGRRKRLHYASTLSVFVGTDHNRGNLEESDDLRRTSRVFGGYAQTKWAAEVLLRNSRAYAGPISVYRLGLLAPRRAGSFAKKDWLGLIIRGILSLECLPTISGSPPAFDVTPVDYAAGAIAHLSLAHRDGGLSTFHLANSRAASIEDLAEAFGKAGRRLIRSTPEVWNRKIFQRLNAGIMPEDAASLLALYRFLAGPHGWSGHRSFDLFQATGVRFDTRNSQTALAGSEIPHLPPAADLLTSYVRSLMEHQGASA